jgi:hypothetical protein
VLRRPVLAALAAGIAANDDDAARAALRSYDRILRGFARRKLERVLIDAALATEGGPAHVMRVAALDVSKRAANVTDEAAVAQVYAQLPAATMPRLPVWTVLATIVAALCITFGTFALLHAVAHKSRLYARPLPPPSAGAYADGGVPLQDPALDKLLDEDITRLVADTGRAQESGGTIEPLLTELRTPPAIASHGPALIKAWHGLLDAYGHAAHVADQQSSDALREAAHVVTQEFASAGLGYFLEGRVRREQPIVQAYRVDEVVFVTAGGKPRRVLSLRRLDHLNLSWALLGMQSEDIGDPVVLLDQIDENVASTVLPVLVLTASYELAEPEWLATDVGRELGKQVGEVVRGELTAALGADAQAAGKIAALLVERKRITDEWRDSLDERGLTMADIDDLYLPDKMLSQLENLVPKYQQRRVAEIEDTITELEAPRIATRLRELLAATVRRHEAQHGFDDDRETELRYPAPLEALLGAPLDGDGKERGIVHSARAELSAYLSQVANDPATPHLALWNLARQVFTEDRVGTGESYAAVVILEGLARQLGVTVDEQGNAFDRDHLAGLAKRIAAQPADRLRGAAAKLWTELYGEPLTTIVDQPAVKRPAR